MQAAVVSITMNSVTTTMTLQNESGDPVAHDALNVNAGKNTYVFKTCLRAITLSSVTTLPVS